MTSPNDHIACDQLCGDAATRDDAAALALEVAAAGPHDTTFLYGLVKSALTESAAACCLDYRERAEAVVTALLGAHAGRVDAKGETLALHATRSGSDALVRRLLCVDGVDVSTRSCAGEAPIEIAVARV